MSEESNLEAVTHCWVRTQTHLPHPIPRKQKLFHSGSLMPPSSHVLQRRLAPAPAKIILEVFLGTGFIMGSSWNAGHWRHMGILLEEHKEETTSPFCASDVFASL